MQGYVTSDIRLAVGYISRHLLSEGNKVHAVFSSHPLQHIKAVFIRNITKGDFFVLIADHDL